MDALSGTEQHGDATVTQDVLSPDTDSSDDGLGKNGNGDEQHNVGEAEEPEEDNDEGSLGAVMEASVAEEGEKTPSVEEVEEKESAAEEDEKTCVDRGREPDDTEEAKTKQADTVTVKDTQPAGSKEADTPQGRAEDEKSDESEKDRGCSS